VILLLATRNRGKALELCELLARENVVLDTLADHPNLPDVEETGKTFEENARLKASAGARATGTWALGEDSGLEVDALDGAPGVFSARYAGVHGDDAANNALLLRELGGKTDRRARFVCCMALARPDGSIAATSRGFCEGRIREEPAGTGGFGYDPLFVPENGLATLAELEAREKSLLSHRGQALRAILGLLRMHLGLEPRSTSPG
jgi:XTP/dITP diphosphohydrolase